MYTDSKITDNYIFVYNEELQRCNMKQKFFLGSWCYKKGPKEQELTPEDGRLRPKHVVKEKENIHMRLSCIVTVIVTL
jgi:hypothetical protein